MGRIERRLRERIRRHGPMPFAVFMEEALYGEGGYYASPELRIGPGGDFVTAPSLTPAFARVTARLLRRLDEVLGESADYLEVGYGGGQHLHALSEEPDSGNRRIVAVDRVPRELPPAVEVQTEIAEVIPRIRGLVLSYELFDALPVHRLIGRRGRAVGELWVGLRADGQLDWVEGDLSDPALATMVAGDLEPGQIADLAPGWRPLYGLLADRLERGLIVTFDYGYAAARLLDARVRRHGTLAAYRRQRVHRNPFVAVGDQDLTAHIDFSALAEVGTEAGLDTLLFTRQAPWLAAGGLLEEIAGLSGAERITAMQLLDLDGMGEEIRVLVQARGLEAGEVLPPELLDLRPDPL